MLHAAALAAIPKSQVDITIGLSSITRLFSTGILAKSLSEIKSEAPAIPVALMNLRRLYIVKIFRFYLLASITQFINEKETKDFAFPPRFWHLRQRRTARMNGNVFMNAGPDCPPLAEVDCFYQQVEGGFLK